MLFGVEGLQVTDAQAGPDGMLEVWAVTDYPAAAACPDVSGVPSHQTGRTPGQAFFWSRRQRRMPPRTAPRIPRPVMTAMLGQSGLVAGAGTMWKKTDVSSSQ